MNLPPRPNLREGQRVWFQGSARVTCATVVRVWSDNNYPRWWVHLYHDHGFFSDVSAERVYPTKEPAERALAMEVLSRAVPWDDL